jgi:hypothetical protein
MKCFETNCDGTLEDAVIDYKQQLNNEDTIVINKLKIKKCNKCEMILFDSAASKQIESEIIIKYPNYFQRKIYDKR